MSVLGALLHDFARLRVLVVGDALLDDYLYGAGLRIAREAPIPAVTVGQRRPVPGGAANTAANVAALGASVHFLTVLGDDADGRTLRSALLAQGVPDADLLVEPGRVTAAKRRVVAGDQLVVRFDEGGPAPLQPATEELLITRLRELLPGADAVIVSDYDHGVVGDAVVDALTALRAQRRGPLVVDARRVARYRAVRASAVKPNYDEVRALLPAAPTPGGTGGRAEAVVAGCEALLDATGADMAAVTLDRDGAVLCERGRPTYRTWTRPVPHSRACGAGDSYTAALALALGAGADGPSAAEIAQAAAAVVTGRDGTSVCSIDDLREHLAETTTRLEDPDGLGERLAYHRRQGRRIVFTNGFFDVLHRGHVDLLNRAKALGDVLVVGLNADDADGALRNTLEDRAGVLAALSSVDHLVAFAGPTADALIDLVRPDVYVKGGDYTADMVPETASVRAAGGVVQIVPYLQDRPAAAGVTLPGERLALP